MGYNDSLELILKQGKGIGKEAKTKCRMECSARSGLQISQV